MDNKITFTSVQFVQLITFLQTQYRKNAVEDFVQAIKKEYDVFDDDDEIYFGSLRRDLHRIAKDFK